MNISNIDSTGAQIEALQKGLTLCPSPGPPKKSLTWNDFKALHRRLVLQYHFYNDNNILDSEDRELVNILAGNLDSEHNPYQSIHAKFKPKSNWLPNNTHISLIASNSFLRITYSTVNQLKIDKIISQKSTHKNQLTKNPDIIIKKADKGSVVLVMNTKD